MKRNDTMVHAMTYMTQENITPSETKQEQCANMTWYHLDEVNLWGWKTRFRKLFSEYSVRVQ